MVEIMAVLLHHVSNLVGETVGNSEVTAECISESTCFHLIFLIYYKLNILQFK